MKTELLLILIMVSFSHVALATELSMAHKINVPQEYANGRTQEAFEGTSDIECYIGAFEKTWWAVMNRFAHDINWQPKHDDFICSGTSAAAQGCIDGYEQAVRRVGSLLKSHNAASVQEFIKDKIGK